MITKTRNLLMITALSITGVCFVGTTNVKAQEGELDYLNPESGIYENYESTDSPDPENTLIKTEQENQLVVKSKVKSTKAKATTNQTDSAKSSSGPTVGESNGTKEGESVLSFNFLYYIIQKFKFTDVVDQ